MSMKKENKSISLDLEFYQTLLQTLPAILIVEKENGEIIFCNKDDSFLKSFLKKEQQEKNGSEIYFQKKYYQKKVVPYILKNQNYRMRIYGDVTRYKSFEKETKKDLLTNLLNKKMFECQIRQLAKEQKNNQKNFVLAMGDLDYFREINERIGQFQADEILKQIGEVLLANIRKTDLAFRFGGDEFAIIFHDCDLKCAHKMVERIQKQIKKLSRDHMDIQISFGLSVYDGTKSLEQVKNEADAALYQSKKERRDQTNIYPFDKDTGE